ncbi:MAG: sulfite exporter TauE/SafE family protein [bacterium]|nr:sulfite exporter TauE/SafE family protein [bacterium]
MDLVIVAIAVVFASGLTFFSGFGLGTIMLPVFSLFFDVSIAVGATAIVHLANNIFKFALVSKHIHFPTLLRFGIPAMIFGAIGGLLLKQIDGLPILLTYELNGSTFEITTVKVVIGILMIFFAIFDLSPRLSNIQVQPKHLPIGGVLSGFFGGVSGHQGAFRATFLTKVGLTKEQFIGTSNSVSLAVDLARLIAYFVPAAIVTSSSEIRFREAILDGQTLLIVGIVFAFLGTFLGKQLVKKTTIKGIQRTVGVLLIVMGVLMGFGLI